MIWEYAVDPRKLGNHHEIWLLLNEFGSSKGRLIAQFPKWHQAVREQINKSNCKDVEKLRLNVRLEKLSHEHAFAKSNRPFSKVDWLRTTLEDHNRRPFRAIITDDPNIEHSCVISPSEAHNENPLWVNRTEDVISRSAEAIAAFVQPLAKLSFDFLFVDPYLGSENSFRTIEKILRVAGLHNGKKIGRFEFHVTEKSGLLRELKPRIEKQILEPLGIESTLTIYQWENADEGERLHARYFLTNVGGVRIDCGFGQRPSTTTDIELLGLATYRKRWEEYCEPTMIFNQIDKLEIGQKKRLLTRN